MVERITKILFLIILAELCLGGGGRLTAIGPVSLRMILFASAIGVSIFHLWNGKKIANHYSKILSAFALVILVGVIIGLINHSPIRLIWEDVKPLLYFFILPFFDLVIDRNEVTRASKVIKVSSLAIAAMFFLVLILIHTGLLPFLSFYNLTLKTEEFFYRGELSFFYKGFLFLGIGSIFFYFNEPKKYFFIAILVVAIILSVTRGLLFSLAGTFAIYYFFQQKKFRSITAAAFALAIVLAGNQGTILFSQWLDSKKTEKPVEVANPHLFGHRKYSDEGRVSQIKEVAEQISFSSVFIGHGFGQGIPARPVHMEIAYLEVFHKQGIIGLAFWFALAVMIFVAYNKSDQSSLANAFLFSSLFVFVESATNQYFNNPIGLSVLLLSLVCLDKLKKS